MKNKIIKFRLMSDIGLILFFLYIIISLNFKHSYIGLFGICLSILMLVLDLKVR